MTIQRMVVLLFCGMYLVEEEMAHEPGKNLGVLADETNQQGLPAVPAYASADISSSNIYRMAELLHVCGSHAKQQCAGSSVLAAAPHERFETRTEGWHS